VTSFYRGEEADSKEGTNSSLKTCGAASSLLEHSHATSPICNDDEKEDIVKEDSTIICQAEGIGHLGDRHKEEKKTGRFFDKVRTAYV
jgi:hypothetical protein